MRVRSTSEIGTPRGHELSQAEQPVWHWVAPLRAS
jgi:hypothetical protein